MANIPVDFVLHKEQRVRLGATLPAGAAALLQGGKELPLNDTDVNYLFRQESYFRYLFGLNEPDLFGVVEGGTGNSILFIPRLPESYAVWLGTLPTPESVKEHSGVDEVLFVDEMAAWLKAKAYATIHVLAGTNSDSGLKALTASFEGIEEFKNVSSDSLYTTIAKQRVYKTDREAAVLRRVCKISSIAHVAVMQGCKPGMSQHQLEASFLHHVYFHGGCRFVSYTCICATGGCGATLHYPNNDRPVKDGEMALLDMGAEYNGYASDITCSYPTNGKFTREQAFVYNAVLDAQRAVIKAMRPGVSWVDMHLLAQRTMLLALLKEGLVKWDGALESEDALRALEATQIMYTFMPHGLGHLVGLDVHDVGGYLPGDASVPTRPVAQSCCRLRTARVLEPRTYITVEPGLYFNHALLEKAFADATLAPLLDEKRIRAEFWGFGGVRIEDDVMVTENGCVNYTCCPRTVEEIEATMRGEKWDSEPAVYTH